MLNQKGAFGGANPKLKKMWDKSFLIHGSYKRIHKCIIGSHSKGSHGAKLSRKLRRRKAGLNG